MIGARLKQARIAAGLSLRQLAEKTDKYVSAQAIHKYELGKATPGSDVLLRLAKALCVRVEFFFRPASIEVKLGEPAFRKRSSASAKHLQAIRAKQKDWVEKYLEVESLFAANRFKVDFPNVRARHIRKLEDVELFARALRRVWKLGVDPIDNLTEVLEDRGVKVVMLEGQRDFDGLSCWANDKIAVIVVNKDKPTDRLRMSMAHELGHLLMDLSRNIDPEKAVRRFAGAFLVPEEAVRLELGSHRHKLNLYELQTLRHKYGMSVQAWIYRAGDLGIVSQSYVSSVFRAFHSSGIEKRELGKPLPTEKPMRFERLLIQAVDEELTSPARAAELLDVSLNEFRKRIRVEFSEAKIHS
jgi:Zn-dependent peptidase ImmA (M78 family)/DNA-binding XRE family transcriptional regulator